MDFYLFDYFFLLRALIASAIEATAAAPIAAGEATPVSGFLLAESVSSNAPSGTLFSLKSKNSESGVSLSSKL